MPTVPSTTQPTPSTGAGAAAGKPVGPSLGKDDFLKLLVGQLKNQDPMNPTSDTDFIGQMAQFSQLEQTTNMATANSEQIAQQTSARAVSLLGRNVTYPNAAGVSTTGVVEKVEWSAGKPTLTVGGTAAIDPNSVTAVS
ncbi:MAG: flagellar basal-body rod modification protein FlgD [Solirubrobacteraceae bacterium]|jgi:flagellar basal-body rod modification protein FlgD|nr:flagellar basal-body rod modification protein FlgD [Solirubrobacteraceae bacterium]MEA2242911.1 flagellar basal-body rod modification protein FlgD [Solirubrobacteraceae bacterium]